MGKSLTKRLASLLTLLIFAVGISYHHLCDAEFVECSPCHSEHTSSDQDSGCETCEHSARLVQNVQLSKQAEVALASIFLVSVLTSEFVYPEPEQALDPPESPSADLQLQRALRDIKRGIPIRGPSFAV